MLFTFPSRYWFTIGHRVVLSLRRWASQIHTGFHVTRATWEHVKEVDCLSLTGLSPSMARLIQTDSARQPFCNFPRAPYFPQVMSRNPTNTTDMAYHVLMVWAGPRSLATTSGVAFLLYFPPGTKMFQFPGLASLTYEFSQRSPGFARRGFPIRRSTGSLHSSKPWLIAGSYVLHRLSVPRHPPHALNSLVKKDFDPIRSRTRTSREFPGLELVVFLRARCFPRIQLSKIGAALVAAKKLFARPSRERLPGPPPNGGDDRDRTDGLRLAKPALSQLSYIPGTSLTGASA